MEQESTKAKPKAKPDLEAEVLQLREDLTRLTKAFEKVSCHVGVGNIIVDLGYERWIPGKKDMSKFK